MKRFYKKASLFLFLFAVFAVTAGAQVFPRPMNPPRLVNDFAGILSAEQRDALEKKLVDFDRTTSSQIAVVTVTDLQGLDRSDYAARLFDQWGIGGSKNDNGILILVKPKLPDSNGEVFISTGYGLEGAVPDALAGRIVDYDMMPSFMEGDYYKGLDLAASTLISLTRGEFTAQEYLDKHENPIPGIIFTVILLGFFVLLFVLSRKGNDSDNSGGGSGGGTRHRSGPFIPPVIIGGGGSRGGGFSGGGFGGFGGGRTGGGGAGRSW